MECQDVQALSPPFSPGAPQFAPHSSNRDRGNRSCHSQLGKTFDGNPMGPSSEGIGSRLFPFVTAAHPAVEPVWGQERPTHYERVQSSMGGDCCYASVRADGLLTMALADCIVGSGTCWGHRAAKRLRVRRRSNTDCNRVGFGSEVVKCCSSGFATCLSRRASSSFRLASSASRLASTLHRGRIGPR